MQENNVPKHLINVGNKMKEGWKFLASKYDIDLDISGMHPLGHIELKYENPLVLKTLFTQLMLEKGFFASKSFYASYAHKEEHVEKYLDAVDDMFEFISKTIYEEKPDKYLKGHVCHSGFRRLT